VAALPGQRPLILILSCYPLFHRSQAHRFLSH
jgi:hypothetical protein